MTSHPPPRPGCAGTLNGTGALRVKVEHDATDSVIARIVAMVEEASETKAPTQLFIEKIEQRYSIGIVFATLAVFALPLAFGADLTGSLLRAMTFMIVASPCAVVLATMPPLLSAIANAGRHGVLVKSAVVMERLDQVDAIALDKTGTLTEGTPRVTTIHPLAGTGLTGDDLLTLAAAAEHSSEHPLARALVDAAHERGLDIPHAEDFTSTPGIGVTATIDCAVIVRDELATVPTVVALSRAARRLVIQNLIIASVFISVLVVWDLVGHLPLPLGVLGHEGSTVIVGLNGLRLLREAAWRRAAAPDGDGR